MGRLASRVSVEVGPDRDVTHPAGPRRIAQSATRSFWVAAILLAERWLTSATDFPWRQLLDRAGKGVQTAREQDHLVGLKRSSVLVAGELEVALRRRSLGRR